MDRDTYRYNFRNGRKIVHTGITRDLEGREQEHRQRYPDGEISQVGPMVTIESALEWVEEERKRGKPASDYVHSEECFTSRSRKSE